jgi:hypothetical protein
MVMVMYDVTCNDNDNGRTVPVVKANAFTWHGITLAYSNIIVLVRFYF